MRATLGNILCWSHPGEMTSAGGLCPSVQADELGLAHFPSALPVWAGFRAAFQLLKWNPDTDLQEPTEALSAIMGLSFHTHSPSSHGAFPILNSSQLIPHINEKQIVCDAVSCKFSGWTNLLWESLQTLPQGAVSSEITSLLWLMLIPNFLIAGMKPWGWLGILLQIQWDLGGTCIIIYIYIYFHSANTVGSFWGWKLPMTNQPVMHLKIISIFQSSNNYASN